MARSLGGLSCFAFWSSVVSGRERPQGLRARLKRLGRSPRPPEAPGGPVVAQEGGAQKSNF